METSRRPTTRRRLTPYSRRPFSVAGGSVLIFLPTATMLDEGPPPAPHRTHSVGRGKRDLHFGVTLQLGQVGTTSPRSTEHNSPVITTRPANIYDEMLGSWDET